MEHRLETARQPAHVLKTALQAALDAAQPGLAIRKCRYLPDPPGGRTVVVGAGKAAATMARAVEEVWPGELAGVVITRYGYGGDAPPRTIRLREAAHPVPDKAGVDATGAVLAELNALGPDDLVLALISGGGSALLTLPIGVTLEDKQTLTNQLLRSGAAIHEINAVRKHLSGIKGGQLAAAACPARIVSLIVSDVVGDDLAVIASGPTVPDPSTYSDALAVLDRYRIDHPAVQDRLRQGCAGRVPETPKPGDPLFDRVENRLICTNRSALDAAAQALSARGYSCTILSDQVEGESRRVAREQASQVESLGAGQALISGGETTVTIRGTGRGGPNLEYLLALSIALEGQPDVYALAADTDGIDGSSDAAGAIITPDTLARARRLGLDPAALLADNDAYAFFDRLGDLVRTGPTGTNVNDIRIIIRRNHESPQIGDILTLREKSP